MLRKFLLFIVIVSIAVSCGSSSQLGSTSLLYKDYRVEKESKKDSALIMMLQPYSVTLDATMNKVIAVSNNGLGNKQPESALGNLMADCMRIMAEKKFERKVDAGFMNQFGIRSTIPKGNITVGKIFEIMPFDNLVVIQEIKGNVLKEFFDRMAADGGWPVSAGVKMNMKDKKAVNITINNKPLDENATYVIANSDYVASGGDNCEMLRKVPMISKGYLFRDALMEFIGNYTKQGKPVDYTIENRVSNAN
jgi:2',3'-cyclic-nucleotide 2'-phosphodiesterase (5'-nucleotidase family)